MRVGVGYDSHRFDASRPCILGGVLFPESPGLRGVSDADAVAHAVTDALLGAVGDGDIGAHFPPSDPTWEGADSMELLRRMAGRLAGLGWTVGNVDVTVICEAPRIGPAVPAMRARLAEVLGVDPLRLSVKGKTNETMGWEGRGEGIAVHAVALVGRMPAAIPPVRGGAAPHLPPL
ncbi:MAG: 2-C-methyl-D-erythritol 2,4-cyclodiphosphate synthase [Gemmatimonadales bacterium]|nr:MAG: 2-C-methyl-D-erythritol 2,4-cyclodiphosphate synthase [Gemmatimonadales bacterium]